MQTLTDEQLNALPREAILILYRSIAQQLDAMEKRDAENQKKIEALEKKIDLLLEDVRILTNHRFGRKTEQAQVDGQYSFDADGKIIGNEAEKIAEEGPAPEPQEQEVITYSRKRSAGKREADLKSVRIEEDPAVELSEEKLRELFPFGYKRLPDEIYSKLDYIPAEFVLHHRHIAVYSDKKNEGTIVRADHPNELMPHSLLTESLGAAIITAKYECAVPLNRYSEAIARQFDVHISRQVMAGWVIELYKRFLFRIYERMHEKLLDAKLIHCDESPFKLIHPPNPSGPNHKSYMWVYHTHEKYGAVPIYLYQYCDGRSSDYPTSFLNGYQGILVTDGYQVYHSLSKKSQDLTVAGCWVHAKRKFAVICKADGAEKSKGTTAFEASRRISQIYHVENLCKAKSSKERLEYRNVHVRPLVDAYFAWLRQVQPMTDRSSATGRAITYSLNQETYLRAFLSDGIIPLDNNDAERSIRKFVVGRKNWVIIDSVNGAEASAGLYSIVETAKANGLRTYFYIRHVLSVMKEHIDDVFNKDESYLDDLLPWSGNLPEECRVPEKTETADTQEKA